MEVVLPRLGTEPQTRSVLGHLRSRTQRGAEFAVRERGVRARGDEAERVATGLGVGRVDRDRVAAQVGEVRSVSSPPMARSTASGAHVSHGPPNLCCAVQSTSPSAAARILFPAPA